MYVYDYDIPLLELDISMPVLIKQLAQPTLSHSFLSSKEKKCVGAGQGTH